MTRSDIFDPDPVDIDRVLIVGDSISRQLFEAAKVLAANTEAAPEIAYLISAGPAVAGDDWPALLVAFVPDPAHSAVLVSFGTWQATPPPGVADEVLALATEELQAEIRSYLAPFMDLAVPAPPTLWLRPSVDDAVANPLLQAANALIEPIALELGVPIRYVTAGALDPGSGRAVVLIDGTAYPLRNEDATHYCPAPALVMAHRALAAQGVPMTEVNTDHVAQLLRATDGLGLFTAAGCEPVTG